MNKKTKDLIWSIGYTIGIILTLAFVFFGGMVTGTQYPLDMGVEDIRWEGTIQLDDTRRVPCVATGYGLSCDWAHADGADAMGGDA